MKKIVVFTLILISTNIYSQEKLVKNVKNEIFFKYSFGYSNRTARISKQIPQQLIGYINALKSGVNHDFGFYFNYNETSGLGIKTNIYKSKASGSSLEFGKFGDDVSIVFIGPSFYIAENSSAKSGEAFLEVGLGYINFRNNSYINSNQNYTINGGSIGFSVTGAYHFRLSKHFLIGPQIAYTGGVLNKYNITNPGGKTEEKKLNKDEKESLYHIDLNVSLKYKF